MNLTPNYESCSTWVEQLTNVVSVFHHFIEAVETNTARHATYSFTLSATSGMNLTAKKLRMLPFCFFRKLAETFSDTLNLAILATLVF